MKSLMLLLAVVIVPSVLSQDRWTPDMMIAFKRVSSPALSADGRFVAYVVSTPNMEGEKSEFISQIWVASADGKQNSQYTFGEKSSSNPRFSPDGNYLAFTSSRGSDSKNQVWILRMAGGEAEQVTKAKTGVGSYQWSPDGKRIAYTMVDPDAEQEEKDAKEKRDWNIADQNFKYAHLHTVGIAKDGKERKVQRLTGGKFHVTSFVWSPDGKTISFSHQENPTADV